ncbi:S1 RNA-binding domain-containing protein, partial [Paenibacillus farraposensis]
ANLSTADLGDAAKTATLTKVDPVPLLATVGAATLVDIVASLQHPGRDLRDQMPAPLLRKDVLTMEDLQPGMQLQGTVRNVVDFGAFVDIGVKHDGLVHISRLAKKHVRDASSVVAVGDIVTVWIAEVDMVRERIELTMIDPDED